MDLRWVVIKTALIEWLASSINGGCLLFIYLNNRKSGKIKVIFRLYNERINMSLRNHPHWVRYGWFMVIFSVLWIGFSTPTLADDVPLVVTSLADTNTVGTLRWAISESNTRATADVIIFEEGLTGTILLTSDLPALTDITTITGLGEDVITIDGGGLYDFVAETGLPQHITISNLTLTKFIAVIHAGAGVVNLTDVTITHSGEGDDPFLTYPALMITNTDLTMTRVTMADNSATFAGALTYGVTSPAHTLTITDSTFIRNGAITSGTGG